MNGDAVAQEVVCDDDPLLDEAKAALPEGERKPYLAAHDAIVKAIEAVLVQGPLTRDLGGKASTTEVGEAISKLLAG